MGRPPVGLVKGAIRVVDGEVNGFRRPRKWKRGCGRWVGDVLVWTKGPTLLRSEVFEVDRIVGDVRAAGPGDKVTRLGKGL